MKIIIGKLVELIEGLQGKDYNSGDQQNPVMSHENGLLDLQGIPFKVKYNGRKTLESAQKAWNNAWITLGPLKEEYSNSETSEEKKKEIEEEWNKINLEEVEIDGLPVSMDIFEACPDEFKVSVSMIYKLGPFIKE